MSVKYWTKCGKSCIAMGLAGVAYVKELYCRTVSTTIVVAGIALVNELS
jgi:hypothetical protein